uniref:Uncharacterized protein n=1 Tax=viral metagenome TaxID=1070528 RepID=A0A6C0CQV8_9ZZZZ
MAVNSYKLWTEEDIDTLDKLYQMNLTVSQMARCLNRTERSIEHAIKNLLIQQVLHHGTQNVVEQYNVQERALYEELAPDKYYQNIIAPSNSVNPAWPIVAAGCLLYICVASVGHYYDYHK